MQVRGRAGHQRALGWTALRVLAAADVVAPQSLRAPRGGGLDRLVEGEVLLQHRGGHAEVHRRRKGRTGVEVGCDGDGHTRVHQATRRREILARGQVTGWQQRGHGIRSGQQRHILIRDVIDVVHAGRAHLHGKFYTRALAQLVAVHAHAQAYLFAGLENAAGMLFIERAALTEHVDPLHVVFDRVQHRADDLFDVLISVCSRRHQVCAQERHLIYVAGGHTCCFRFRFNVKAVAGFRLKGSGASRMTCGHTLRHQFV